MSNPKIDFASLRTRTVPLSAGRASAIEAVILDRLARRKTYAHFIQGGAALTTVALAALLLVRHRLAAAPVTAPPASIAAVTPSVVADVSAGTNGDLGGIVLGDGSRVRFLVAGTQLAQSGTTGRQSTLVSGAARFDVVHDASAPFRVTAGSVVIEDVGTVFTVRLGSDGNTLVSVESGAVSVHEPDGEKTLVAGASETFPRPMPSAISSASVRSPAPPAPPSWQKMARAGDYKQAFAMIERTGTPVHDDPEELLLAADSARLAGQPGRAVPFLRRLTDHFPADSRAGLAAFTLGRVLLDDLGQPRDAAQAFATAYAHGGPLAEDALAREVEAWARANDRAAAKSTATRYLDAYPTGRHAALVRKLVEPL